MQILDLLQLVQGTNYSKDILSNNARLTRHANVGYVRCGAWIACKCDRMIAIRRDGASECFGATLAHALVDESCLIINFVDR